MARWRRNQRKNEQEDALGDFSLHDDFRYDELPEDAAVHRSAVGQADDPGEERLTPEEALRSFRQDAEADPPEEERKPFRPLSAEALLAHRFGVKDSASIPKKSELSHRTRAWAIALITLLLTTLLMSMLFFRITSAPILGAPEGAISRVVAPVQSAFSTVTEGIAGYFRTWKLRSHLETAYNELRAENERLVYRAMLADELQTRLSQYENMSDEVRQNSAMNPIVGTVIGRGEGNYFSTFTINRGSRDGIKPYMAVTISGALIGYTEEVDEATSTVRGIIDSEASIAGLIQSSRDQGTITGTLGIDGKPACRMYYLSDDHLPRPGDVVVTSGVGMSFPKGIPIGTVRESTRGMDANKRYIVVDPTVDFEHLEYVIVLRYQPDVVPVTGRDADTVDREFVETEPAKPYPDLQIGDTVIRVNTTHNTPTPDPNAAETLPTVAPGKVELAPIEDTEGEKPAKTIPAVPVYEYQPIATGPTPAPTATPTPTATPRVTLNPADMTYEEDE